MYKFTINNIDVTQGIANWDEMKIAIKRDVANRIVRVELPQEMTFTGECYKIINDVFLANGYCSIVSMEISKETSNNSGSYKHFFDGLIFINECEFDDLIREVVAPIRDNSFLSRINNNKEVAYNTESVLTKNYESLVGLSTIFITMFNQTTGVFNGGFAHSGDREGYDWFDVVNNIVLFATDNELSVVSDWYTNLDVSEKLLIIYGVELRTATHTDISFFISFEWATRDVFKAFNLWMTIEGNTLRIEPESYFFNTTELFTLENVPNVKRTFTQSNFYSNVLFGSSESINIGAFPIIRFLSFEKEDYYLGGKCNIRNTLSLEFSNFITDANLIEDVLLNDTATYDKDLFIIQYDNSINQATKNTISPLSGVYYNTVLMNISIGQRYGFSSGMFSVLDSLADRFQATATLNGAWSYFNFTYDVIPLPPYGTSNQVIWNNELSPNFDSNNRFNNATNAYTVSTTGYYSFYVNWKVSLNILDKTDTNGLMLYQRVLSLVPGEFDDIFLLTQVNSGIDHLEFSGNYEVEAFISDIFLQAGTVLYFIIADFGQNTPRTLSSYCYFDIQFLADSYGKCLSTPISGGEYIPANPDVFKSSLFSFEKKLSQQQVDDLLDTPYKAFNFNQDGQSNKKVWANEISINLSDNIASIEAISDIENSG